MTVAADRSNKPATPSQNRSQFTNEILSQAKKNQLLKELEDAYMELANDSAYEAETQLWEVAVGDGLH